MGTEVHRIAELLLDPPRVEAELLDSVPWEERIGLVRPVMDAYFKRTRLLSGKKKLNFKDTPSFGLTNETFHDDVLRPIAGTGGAYIGVGAMQNFIFPVIAGASHAFAVDFDASIPFGFVPMWGALLALSPTRVHFAANLFSRVLDARIEDDLKDASGYKVIDEVSYLPKDRALIGRVYDALAAHIPSADAMTAIAGWLTRLRHDVFDFLRLYNTDRLNVFTSEEAYQGQRALFLNGRITGAVADWTTGEIGPVLGALAAAGMPLGLVYLSNTEEWFPKKNLEPADVLGISTYYRNLREMSLNGTPRVISSLEMCRPAIFDMQGYLRRAFPYEAKDGEAARYYAEFADLRQLSIRLTLGEWGASGMLPWQRLWQAFLSVRGALMKGLLDDASDLARLNGDRQFSWDEFELKMSEASDAYRTLPPEVKEMFKFNMMDIGIVAQPSIVPYAAGELAVQRRIGALLPSGEAPPAAFAARGATAQSGAPAFARPAAAAFPRAVMPAHLAALVGTKLLR